MGAVEGKAREIGSAAQSMDSEPPSGAVTYFLRDRSHGEKRQSNSLKTSRHEANNEITGPTGKGIGKIGTVWIA